MKRSIVAILFAMAVLVSGLAYAGALSTISVPKLDVPSKPSLVVISGTYVYLAPDVATDLFFYHGAWYRNHNDKWYKATSYDGAWVSMKESKVSSSLRKLPSGYRSQAASAERLKYDDVMKNWDKWEDEKHWDKKSQPATTKAAPATTAPATTKPASATTAPAGTKPAGMANAPSGTRPAGMTNAPSGTRPAGGAR